MYTHNVYVNMRGKQLELQLNVLLLSNQGEKVVNSVEHFLNYILMHVFPPIAGRMSKNV